MKLEHWANWAEIGASLAVVGSILFLVQEVRYNTVVLERQALLDRATAFNNAFLDDSPLPAIAARIKAVDGPEPAPAAFVERYDLGYDEAERWVRHLALIWTVLEADFLSNGRSRSLDAIAGGLLSFPDNRLYWERGAPQVTSDEFRTYVAALAGDPGGP